MPCSIILPQDIPQTTSKPLVSGHVPSYFPVPTMVLAPRGPDPKRHADARVGVVALPLRL